MKALKINLLYSKKTYGQAFKGTEVHKSTREFLHGLNLCLVSIGVSAINCWSFWSLSKKLKNFFHDFLTKNWQACMKIWTISSPLNLGLYYTLSWIVQNNSLMAVRFPPRTIHAQKRRNFHSRTLHLLHTMILIKLWHRATRKNLCEEEK